jgi:hypothetical protein
MTQFVTSGQESDQLLVPTTHGAIDHTAGPLNLLDAVAHAAIDHSSIAPGKITLLSAQFAQSGQTLTYTVPGGTLSTNNDMLIVLANALTPSGVVNSIIAFGGAPLLTSPIGLAQSHGIIAWIARTSATSQRAQAMTVGQTSRYNIFGGGAATLANPNDLALDMTGAGGQARDMIVLKMSAA